MKDEMLTIYKYQLKFGCKRSSCTKIFCKSTADDSLAETVASILSLYSDIFVCENINKSFINTSDTKEYKDGGFWCTDLLFFYLNLFQNRKNVNHFFMNGIGEKSPYNSESEDVDNSLNDQSARSISNRKPLLDRIMNLETKVMNINLTLDCEKSHKFCRFFNKETVSQEERIVLTGVVGILLKKYEKSPNYSMGLLIIRIINLLGEGIDFTTQQFSTIHKIFFNIRLFGLNSKTGKEKRSTSSTPQRPFYSEVSNENVENDIPKRSKTESFDNSFSEEVEQYSILIENEHFSTERETQRIIPELPSSNRSVAPHLHNVIMNTDSEIDVHPLNDVQDTSAIEQNQEELTNTDLLSSRITDEDTEECYRNLMTENNTKYTCLNSTVFNRNDLIKSVSTFSSYLNSAVIIDIRDNKKIETSLNIFHLLYLMNEEVLVLGYRRFYLTDFCARIDFREEFKFYRTKSKTPLRYSFILPVHIKAELIKAETNDMMKSSLQDSFFRALFEGHIGPYLFITVNRNDVYKESLDIVRCLNIEDVRKQLRITFKGEEGVDSGGIRKEYFQLLSHEIKHDERLFHITENTIWLKNTCLDMSSYTTIGRILGIALYNNVVLNVPFPSVFFKKLLNKKTTFYDLKEIEPDLFISLSNLKKISAEEIESLALTFTITYTSSKNKIKTYNLTEDNSERLVTKDNVNSFINRYADFYINRLIYRQFEAVKKGFLFVIEKETLLYLDHKELEKIIMGSNDFDVFALRSTASYTGYNEDSEIITWFWEIFESYGRKMKKKLLQFITGNDRIPVSGASSVKLIIMKNGCDTDRLPSSQTCFNTFLLPEYSCKKKLEVKLRTALEMTAGFYLL